MSKRVHFLEMAFLVLLTGIAAAVRWAVIGQRLWLDELTTAWVIRDSWSDILPRSLVNNLSPLFYGLTWLSTRLVGYDEVGIRLPSFLAGILIIPALYGVARSMTGSRLAAFVAALIATVDTSFILYSVEARPYALVQLFALTNMALLIGYLRRQTRTYAILLGLNAALLFYLHYTTALFAAVNVLIVMIAWLRGELPWRRGVADMALAAAVCLAASLPLIPQLLYLSHNRRVLGSFLPSKSLETTLLQFHTFRYIVFPLVLATIVGCLVGAKKENPTEKAGSNSLYLVMALLWFLVPPTVVWGLDSAHLVQINRDRYLITSYAACVLVSIVALQSLFPGRAGVVTFSAVTFGMLGLFVDYLMNTRRDDPQYSICVRRDNHQPWRELVAAVNQSELRDLAVYVDSGLIERRMLPQRDDALFQDYLLCAANSLYRLRPDLLRQAQPVIDPAYALGLADVEEFLYIGSREDLKALQSSVATQAARSGKSYQIQFVFEGASTFMDVMAVHVAFAEKSSSR